MVFARILSLAACLLLLAPPMAAAQGQRKISLIRDTEIENTIRTYAAPVFHAAGLDAESVEVHLVNDMRLNAFVAGGQHIFINTGLLIRADHAGQVIGVIAHETGHITGAHLVRMRDALDRAQTQSIITFLLSAAAAVLTGEPGAAIATSTLGNKVIEGTFLKYSRIQESAADQRGAQLLEGAGISARGLSEFLEILQSQEFMVVARQDPYVRTHPVTTARIDFLRTHMARSRYSQAKLPPAFDEAHRRMQAKLRGFLDAPGRVFAHYKPSDRSLEARYARAVAYHRQTELRKSLAEIDGLIAERPRDPYFHELKGQILFESGRVPEAVAAYKESARLMPGAPLVLTALGQALLELERPEANRTALAHLTDSSRRDPMIPLTWRLLGIAYGRGGNLGMASWALAEEGFIIHNEKQVRLQVRRAEHHLKKGSPGWQRIQDIKRILERSDG